MNWRKFHNEELHNLFLTNIIQVIKSRRIRWTGYVERMAETRSAYEISVGKTEVKRFRCRWEDNIKRIKKD
jgi:hypothetical protein